MFNQILIIFILYYTIEAKVPLYSCNNLTKPLYAYEVKVYNFLKSNNISFCSQATFKDLKKTSKHMRLDFFIYESQLAIEIDEAHHFPSNGSSKKDKDQLWRDSKLNNYFNDNGYGLMRIHWEDIYLGVPEDLLKAFKDNRKDIEFSSNRYKLFINDIWNWTKPPEYNYILTNSVHPDTHKPINDTNDNGAKDISLIIIICILLISNIGSVLYLRRRSLQLDDADSYDSIQELDPVSSDL